MSQYREWGLFVYLQGIIQLTPVTVGRVIENIKQWGLNIYG